MAVDTREVQISGTYGDSVWRIKNVPFDVAQLHIDGWLFVSPGGDDESATGTIARPYATLKKAFASITDASPTKRYTVWVSGPLTEAETIIFPANVFVVGTSPAQTRIQAPDWFFEGWSPEGDNRSGFVNVGIAGPVYALWDSAQAAEAKLYLTGSWLLNDVQVRCFSATNQTIVTGSRFFGNVSQHAGAFESSASVYEQTVMLDTTAVPFRFRSMSDAFLWNLTLQKYTAAESTGELYNSFVKQLDLIGMVCKATAQPASVMLANGSTVEIVTAVATGGAGGTGSRKWTAGAGDPNGVVVGSVGDLYSRTDGTPGATFYVKEAGNETATGWGATAAF